MIVGAGAIAPAHIEGFLHFPERAEIRVIANPTVSRARKLIEKYKLNAVPAASVDVLSVCSPPSSHRDIAVRALEEGKHVLLEKPMALSLEECDAIIGAAQRGGGTLSIVAQSRLISSIYNAIKIVHSGAWGKLLFAQINS